MAVPALAGLPSSFSEVVDRLLRLCGSAYACSRCLMWPVFFSSVLLMRSDGLKGNMAVPADVHGCRFYVSVDATHPPQRPWIPLSHPDHSRPTGTKALPLPSDVCNNHRVLSYFRLYSAGDIITAADKFGVYYTGC